MFGPPERSPLISLLVGKPVVLIGMAGLAGYMFWKEPDKLAIMRQAGDTFDATVFCKTAADQAACADAYQRMQLLTKTIADELPADEVVRCREATPGDVEAVWLCLTDSSSAAVSTHYQRPF